MNIVSSPIAGREEDQERIRQLESKLVPMEFMPKVSACTSNTFKPRGKRAVRMAMSAAVKRLFDI